MTSRLTSTAFALIACIASGCAGGFDCPFDRPSCCDNVLFGCGPFDLPNGCSCGDYFIRSFNGAVKSNQQPQSSLVSIRGNTISDTTGTWRAGGQKKVRTACPLLPLAPTTTLLIREETDRVSMKIQGFTTLKGLRVGNVIKVQGAYKVPGTGCEAFIKTELTPSSVSTSPISSTIDVKCVNKKLSCTVSYSGTAKKLG